MSIQFPTNPQNNQEYTFNNKTWRWNGSAWIGVLEDYITLSIDASPDDISIGKKDSKKIDYDCEFVEWFMLSNQTGVIEFDIKKSPVNQSSIESIIN